MFLGVLRMGSEKVNDCIVNFIIVAKCFKIFTFITNFLGTKAVKRQVATTEKEEVS
jgi:hypothetical protein